MAATRRQAAGTVMGAAAAALAPFESHAAQAGRLRALSPEARIGRNLALAETFYHGYRLAYQRRYNDNWRVADFAPDYVSVGGLNHHRPTPQTITVDYGERSTRQCHMYTAAIPDWGCRGLEVHADAEGAAFTVQFGGHDRAGKFHGGWELEFIRTDAYGRINRWEYYNDWVPIGPPVSEIATGLTEADMRAPDSAQRYGAAVLRLTPDFVNPYPKRPPAPSSYGLPRPQADPRRIARHRDLAQRYHDGWRRARERGFVDSWKARDFAPGAVLSTTLAGGERPIPQGDYGAWASRHLAAYLAALPDFTCDELGVWPSEEGCAFRHRFHGHGADGREHGGWIVHFLWTNHAGQINRWLVFVDRMDASPMIQFVTGLTRAQIQGADGLQLYRKAIAERTPPGFRNPYPGAGA